MNLKGKTVLITGGASGIGKIMGRICLEKGVANLVIWDVNPDNIRRTEIELAGISGSETDQTDANDVDRPKTPFGSNKDRIHSYQVNCADANAVEVYQTQKVDTENNF